MLKLKYIKGILAIAVAVATPFGAWSMDQSTLKAAVMMAVISGLTSIYTWVDQTLAASATGQEHN